MGTGDAGWRTVTGITRTNNEVENDDIWKHAKGCKRSTKFDCEYTIHHIVFHVGKIANTRYVIRSYGYKTADNPINSSTNIPLLIATRYSRKIVETKRVKRPTLAQCHSPQKGRKTWQRDCSNEGTHKFDKGNELTNGSSDVDLKKLHRTLPLLILHEKPPKAQLWFPTNSGRLRAHPSPSALTWQISLCPWRHVILILSQFSDILTRKSNTSIRKWSETHMKKSPAIFWKEVSSNWGEFVAKEFLFARASQALSNTGSRRPPMKLLLKHIGLSHNKLSSSLHKMVLIGFGVLTDDLQQA